MLSLLTHQWLSLMPPIVVILSIYITHQLNVSLMLGMVCAAFIASAADPISALTMCVEKFITHFSDMDNVYLYLLLIAISSLIVLLTVTGSAAGCAQIIGKRMRTNRSAEMSS